MAQPPRQCTLLAGAPALLAQLSLAVLAFASLAYKRHRERPQRPTVIWCMDVTKQIFSSGAGHVCGLIIAVVASTRGGHETSACAWYFVAFTFDTTLGVGLAVLMHKLLVRAARARLAGAATEPAGLLRKRSWAATIASCGDYGDPPSWQRWAVQMAEWVAATVVARAMCGIVVVGARRLLVGVARLLDDAFAGHPTAELFSVMLAGPLAMNLIQAWIQDAVLKMKRTSVDSADEGALLLAERGRSDAPHLEDVKAAAPSRGRPAATAGTSRIGQVALTSLPPEVVRLKGN